MTAMPQTRSLPYIRQESGAIAFRGERAGEVRIPNYVYDLWLPLLGATTIGIYATYTRLQRNRLIWGMTMDELARACRVGKATLQSINRTLAECGFIAVKAPVSYHRYKHYTLEITVNDAPCEVPPAILSKHAHPQGYVPLTHWLVQSDDELLNRPDRTSGSSESDLNRPDRTAKIASLIASSHMDQSLDLITTTCIERGGADAHPPIDQVVVEEKAEGLLKMEESHKPALHIVGKPAQSRRELKTPNPPVPRAPLSPMNREAAAKARSLVELAFEKLCYGSQHTAWDNDITSGKMFKALGIIKQCDLVPLTGARIEEAGRWWYAYDWRGRDKGERPDPMILAGVWPSFVAGKPSDEPIAQPAKQTAPAPAATYSWQKDDEPEEQEPLPAPVAPATPIKRDVPQGLITVWQQCINSLKVRMSPSSFNAWLKGVRLVGYECVDGVNRLRLLFLNEYQAGLAEKGIKYGMLQEIESLWGLSKLETGKIELVFEVAE